MNTLALVVAFLLLPAQSHTSPTFGAGRQANQPLSPQDMQWLHYAATDNQGEIQECLLAEKHAQSLAVKAFARLMVDDHIAIES